MLDWTLLISGLIGCICYASYIFIFVQFCPRESIGTAQLMMAALWVSLFCVNRFLVMFGTEFHLNRTVMTSLFAYYVIFDRQNYFLAQYLWDNYTALFTERTDINSQLKKWVDSLRLFSDRRVAIGPEIRIPESKVLVRVFKNSERNPSRLFIGRRRGKNVPQQFSVENRRFWIWARRFWL